MTFRPLSPTGATAMSERNPAIIARQSLALPVGWKSEKRTEQREVRGESGVHMIIIDLKISHKLVVSLCISYCKAPQT